MKGPGNVLIVLAVITGVLLLGIGFVVVYGARLLQLVAWLFG
ncbi:MAG: hypothetical protein AAGK00_09485 [Pseudomonadota bacterium]